MEDKVELNNGIEKLTEEDYKVNLSSLSCLKFEKAKFYDIENDFKNIGFEDEYMHIVDGRPQYVEFSEEPYPYEKAIVRAINEIYELFINCKSYNEARKKILAMDCCSEENGYAVEPNTTGRLYGSWMVLWGDDKNKTIKWDVRWY